MLSPVILILSQAILESFWKIFYWIWDSNFDQTLGSSCLEEISLKDLLDPSDGKSDFDKEDLSFSSVSFLKFTKDKR